MESAAINCIDGRSTDLVLSKVIHLDNQIDFVLDVLNRFKIESCIHINFYIILNSF